MKHTLLRTTLLLLSGSISWNAAFSQTVSGGDRHSLSVCEDGTVEAWGHNNYGQIGIGTTGFSEELSMQVHTLTDIVAVSAGYSFSLALKNDGTVWGWGNNEGGQLGDGTYTVRLSAVQTSGLTGIIAISAGRYHSLALKNDGTVWCWGENQHGTFGIDTSYYTSNIPVQANITDVVAIAAGNRVSFAVKSDGTVWSWGMNGSGELGIGFSGFDEELPVQVGGLSDVVSVATYNDHSMAVKNDGTVWAWGANSEGELGDGSGNSSMVPVQAAITSVASVDVGDQFSVALKNDGTVWSWGINGGLLGDGTTANSDVPVQALGLTDITTIACGEYHSVAVRSDGTAWSWGQNSFGQLGDNTFDDDSIPAQIPSLCQILGTEENEELSATLYPNPVSDVLYITSQETIVGAVWIDAVGLTGKCAIENAAIDLSGLAEGIYFLQLTSEGGRVVTKRIVKR